MRSFTRTRWAIIRGRNLNTRIGNARVNCHLKLNFLRDTRTRLRRAEQSRACLSSGPIPFFFKTLRSVELLLPIPVDQKHFTGLDAHLCGRFSRFDSCKASATPGDRKATRLNDKLGIFAGLQPQDATSK